MPSNPRTLVIVSPDALFGTLLAAVVDGQGGLTVRARYHTVDAAVANPVSASIVLCDLRAASEPEAAQAIARLAKAFPAASLAPIRARADLPGRLHGASTLEELLAVLGIATPVAANGRGLTRIETEVLLAVARGRRNSDIARAMRRSSKTVEKHRANAMRKLGLRNTAEATAWCIGARLLDPTVVLGTRSPLPSMPAPFPGPTRPRAERAR